mmetsp:Transcript_51748/g.147508  ORF Transcript_51748/g.147508 Transcript_51748/m.147508 type:complete len:254 (+) Transcript_51748:340-1101(+)
MPERSNGCCHGGVNEPWVQTERGDSSAGHGLTPRKLLSPAEHELLCDAVVRPGAAKHRHSLGAADHWRRKAVKCHAIPAHAQFARQGIGLRRNVHDTALCQTKLREQQMRQQPMAGVIDLKGKLQAVLRHQLMRIAVCPGIVHQDVNRWKPLQFFRQGTHRRKRSKVKRALRKNQVGTRHSSLDARSCQAHLGRIPRRHNDRGSPGGQSSCHFQTDSCIRPCDNTHLPSQIDVGEELDRGLICEAGRPDRPVS